MKYIGGALKYVFKNFIFIFPFALLPSYFFAAALDLESLELIVRKLLAADSDVAFIAVFNSFSLINGPRWVFGVISFACRCFLLLSKGICASGRVLSKGS